MNNEKSNQEVSVEVVRSEKTIPMIKAKDVITIDANHPYVLEFDSSKKTQFTLEKKTEGQLSNNDVLLQNNHLVDFLRGDIDKFGGIKSIKVRNNKRTGFLEQRIQSDWGVVIQKESPDKALIERKCVRVSYQSIEERNQRIIELLKLGYSQEEVADIVEVSQSTVSEVKRKYMYA